MERPPSVDRLARSLEGSGLPHPVRVEVARAAIADGEVELAAQRARQRARRLLTPVLNATGTLLHTNLGRAPVGAERRAGYSNLELDLDSGRRGSRNERVGPLLATLVGAEAALVVNNCAASVVLALSALARHRGVVVSRGELVEIGGGFRVPEVMEQSGARLVEVGTTNRTRLSDYRRALETDEEVAVILKVHPSNYRITGFTEEVSVAALSDLGPPVLADLGSGLLDAACPWLPGGPPGWLADEPAARQTLEQGADLVMFSGDKLLGGPQAGIIAGRADLVAACASHPLARALRCGDLVLDALQTVALAYLDRDHRAIGLWRMATLEIDELTERAEALSARAPGWSVSATRSLIGGGSLPGTSLPSVGLVHEGDLTAELREGDPPVIARVEQGRTVCDLRTIDPADDEELAAALARARG